MKLAALIICLSFTGCNLMEGLHQTNPRYENPVPFSNAWKVKHGYKKPTSTL